MYKSWILLVLTLLMANQATADFLPRCQAALEERRWQDAYRVCNDAAEQGFDEAQYNLARLYHMGFGVERDILKAERWYITAAEQGNIEAQVDLGWYYQSNSLWFPTDFDAAAQWLKKAAEHGHPEAQWHLAWLYKSGRGVGRSDQVAVRWLRIAAEQGFSYAQYELAEHYYHGVGVTQDFSAAAHWYRTIAMQGDSMGQQRLGRLYLHGHGVREDLSTAYVWSSVSAAQGNERAKADRDFVLKQLTSTQVEEAQRRSRDCLESGYQNCN